MNLKDKIHTIRGKQVMLDRDLAKLYEVKTKALNQAVKRNKERFPEDFMFRLKKEDFIKQGITALSGVLKSQCLWLKPICFW
jgi:hypothetical protein